LRSSGGTIIATGPEGGRSLRTKKVDKEAQSEQAGQGNESNCQKASVLPEEFEPKTYAVHEKNDKSDNEHKRGPCAAALTKGSGDAPAYRENSGRQASGGRESNVAARAHGQKKKKGRDGDACAIHDEKAGHFFTHVREALARGRMTRLQWGIIRAGQASSHDTNTVS